MKIVGIDPGFQGAAVRIEDGKITGHMLFPVVTVLKSTKTKSGALKKGTEYLEAEMFRQLSELQADTFVLEKSIAMPGQAAQATAAVFLGQGLLRGFITALKTPVVYVAAQTWQSQLFRDCPKGDTKTTAALVCSRTWPDFQFILPGQKKPHSGLCDAALIALYGERTVCAQTV